MSSDITFQESIFESTEGDNWFQRNKNYLEGKQKQDDIVYNYLNANSELVRRKSVLEIGCCTGYRLRWLRDDFEALCYGFDPSGAAIAQGIKEYGFTHDQLFKPENLVDLWNRFKLLEKFGPQSLDTIIFGFSLYLSSPSLQTAIVAQIDRLLKVNGTIIIVDFDSIPQRNRYEHVKDKEIYSYKCQWSKIFTGFPTYMLVYKSTCMHCHTGVGNGDPKEQVALSVIKKISVNFAFPELK